METTTYQGAERRKHVHLRDVFDDACRVAFPLLSAHEEIGGGDSGSSILYLTLHDAFPLLHKQDLPILAAALLRAFRQQQRGAVH
ncbi:MAG: hypothetical protein AB1722_08775 [Pseudomonadota bacterium]